MRTKVGIYKAKSELSRLLRAVKSHGVTIEITDRGRSIALLTPFKEDDSLDSHIQDLIESGLIEPARRNRPPQSIAKRKGALKRFLDHRE